MITLIAAIGDNNELGLSNNLLWKIPEDMRHFKAYTMGKTIIMGRNTFRSLNDRPLPGRSNVLISKSTQSAHGVTVFSDIDAALADRRHDEELVIIGGASIYQQTIGRADRLVITHVSGSYEADTFFPNIDSSWVAVEASLLTDQNYSCRVVRYERH